MNNISARVDLVALVGCPGLTGLIRSRMASGAAGIDGIAGKGFLVRETVGGDFFGMPEEYALPEAGNKARCSGGPVSIVLLPSLQQSPPVRYGWSQIILRKECRGPCA